MTPLGGHSDSLCGVKRTAAIFLAGLACGVATSQAESAVTLEAVTDHAYYRETSDSQVYVEARIGVPRPPGASAAPRNVVFVLDRSGSMAGEPIAALRAAAATAIEALAPGDFVAVVAFGSEVETPIEAQARERVTDVAARLAQIEPAGGAALFDALNQAAAQVRRHASPTTINQIVLVTDGPPTKGPREAGDFAKLAGVFADEGMQLSAIGLGPDFSEDMLAAMARAGQGHFRYVAQADGLAAALRAEIAPPATVVGYDAVLSIEFSRVGRKPRFHNWRPPAIDGQTLTWRIPRLVGDQPCAVLVSAELDAFQARFEIPAFATVRLRWKNPDGRAAPELTRRVALNFTRESADIRHTLDPGVARAGAAVSLREGLQRAIEEIDKGNPRRVLRVLRDARGEIRDLNFDLEDPQITELVRRFDVFLGGLQARPPGPGDRKVFRSGLLGEVEPAAEIVDPN